MTAKNNIDKSYIKHLVDIYGILGCLKFIEKLYGSDMNKSINDSALRIIIWQGQHLLYMMEKYANSDTISITNMQKYINVSDRYLSIMAKNLLATLNSIEEYITT